MANKTVSFVIPEEIKKGIDILARKDERTFSYMVRNILLERLKNESDEEIKELIKNL